MYCMLIVLFLLLLVLRIRRLKTLLVCLPHKPEIPLFFSSSAITLLGLMFFKHFIRNFKWLCLEIRNFENISFICIFRAKQMCLFRNLHKCHTILDIYPLGFFKLISTKAPRKLNWCYSLIMIQAPQSSVIVSATFSVQHSYITETVFSLSTPVLQFNLWSLGLINNHFTDNSFSTI